MFSKLNNEEYNNDDDHSTRNAHELSENDFHNIDLPKQNSNNDLPKQNSNNQYAKKPSYSNKFAFFCGVVAGAAAYEITALANPALTGSFTFAIANLVSSIAPSAFALGLGSALPYLLAALLVGLVAVAINSYINRAPSSETNQGLIKQRPGA